MNNEQSRTPVSYAVNEYLAAAKRDLAASSYIGYSHKLSTFVAWCEKQGIYLEQIRRKVVNDFLEYLRKTRPGRKPGAAHVTDRTLSGYVRCIKTMLYWCIRGDEEGEFRDAIRHVSLLSIRAPRPDSEIIETFSDRHIAGMLEACRSEENECMCARAVAIVTLLNTTGIRAAECCTLTIAHTHTDALSYIKVMGKGRREREVELPNDTRRKLAAYIRKYRVGAEDSATVFVSRTGEFPLTVAGLQQLIRRLGRRAKVRGVRVSPHTFRHTFAARLYTVEKKDVLAISRILGHRNITITEIYLESISSRNVQPGLRRVK